MSVTEPIPLVAETKSMFLHLTDEMLDARIRDMHRNVIDNYLEMAALLAEWKRRKKDIGVFQLAGVGDYLLRVGEGQLTPEVFDRYWPDVDMLAFFSGLLVSQQREYMGGKTIPVATGPHGSQELPMTIETILQTDKKVPGLRSQVFYRNRVNDIARQRALILEREKEASKPLPETIAGMVIDRERGGVMVKRNFISKEDLRRALRALGG
jgi:hypothetical protein